MDFPGEFHTPQVVLVVKDLVVYGGDKRDVVLIPWSERSPKGGHGNPLSILVWKIPWTRESGRLQSIGSQRVGRDWSDIMHTCFNLNIFPMMPLSLLKEIKNDYSPISIHFPCLGEVTNKELKKKRLKAGRESKSKDDCHEWFRSCLLARVVSISEPIQSLL